MFLFGQSLGAALGTYAAATNPTMINQLDGIVLESGFTRYGRITREVRESSDRSTSVDTRRPVMSKTCNLTWAASGKL